MIVFDDSKDSNIYNVIVMRIGRKAMLLEIYNYYY